MDDSQKPQLLTLLSDVMASYNKSLPEAGIIGAWMANLRPYPMSLIEAAFLAYLNQNGEFAPTPAGIAMRCKKMDGRPEAEEAWATALMAQDETSTMIWSTETAEAFYICRPILVSGNAISARPAFLASYTRLVAEARANYRPMKMIVSLGSDRHHKVAVIQRAVDNGLLPARAASPLLEGSSCDSAPSPEGIARLAKMKKELADGREKKQQARLNKFEDERLELKERKRSIDEQVQKYQSGRKA